MLAGSENQARFLAEFEIDVPKCLGSHSDESLPEEGEWPPGRARGGSCEMEAGWHSSPLFAESAYLLQGQAGPRHDHDMTCMHGIYNN